MFDAWADPKAKARWFSRADGEHELDFRVGGVEINRVRHPDGPLMTFESRYHDIVPHGRIVYSSTLSADGVLWTVSVTTVELHREGDDDTRLLLVEQDTFLDGHEQPSWREQGTSDWLNALGAELTNAKEGD